MNKIIGVFFLFFTIYVSGQTQTVVPDTLVKYGGQKVLVIIRNVQATAIYYSLIEKPKETLKIDRKDVEKLIYKNGRVDIFNKTAFTVMKEGQWETVLITYDEKDIQGLYKRKEISATSTPTKSKKKAKENCTIKMQKLAANVGGTIILIKKEEFEGGFDENPSWTMLGIAYGTEPLEEGTNVIEDPKKSTQSGQKKGTVTSGSQQKTTTVTPQQKTTTTTQQNTNSGTTQQKTTTGTSQQKATTTGNTQPKSTTGTQQKTGTTQK